jgi:hypothetical protein
VASLESELAEVRRELDSARQRQSANDEEKGALDTQLTQYKMVLENTVSFFHLTLVTLGLFVGLLRSRL